MVQSQACARILFPQQFQSLSSPELVVLASVSGPQLLAELRTPCLPRACPPGGQVQGGLLEVKGASRRDRLPWSREVGAALLSETPVGMFSLENQDFDSELFL